MSVLIGILDQCNNTDVIAVVDTQKKIVTSIPRDLYSWSICNRVNAAYAKGGLSLFENVIKKAGYPCIASICIPKNVSMGALESASITVPIAQSMEYYYPMSPNQPIEEGKKIVAFHPPQEILSGERIHQFVGARSSVPTNLQTDLQDINRIKRQQIFAQALIKQKFDFRHFLHPAVSLSNSLVFNLLAKVDLTYQWEILDDFFPCSVAGMSVLLDGKNHRLIKRLFGNGYYWLYQSYARLNQLSPYYRKRFYASST